MPVSVAPPDVGRGSYGGARHQVVQAVHLHRGAGRGVVGGRGVWGGRVPAEAVDPLKLANVVVPTPSSTMAGVGGVGVLKGSEDHRVVPGEGLSLSLLTLLVPPE